MKNKNRILSFTLISFFIILLISVNLGKTYAEMNEGSSFGEGQSISEGKSDSVVEGKSISTRLGNEVGNIAQLQAALDAASDGDTITLASDFLVEDIIITVPSKAVIIDGIKVDFSAGTIAINNGQSGRLKFINFKFIAPTGKHAFVVNTSSIIEIEETLISNRTTHGDGSGIWIHSNGNVSIKNTTFENNIAAGSGYSGGAIASKNFSGTLNIENTLFKENKNTALGTGVVGGEGGAIYIANMYPTASVTIKNSFFEGNEAVKDASSLGYGRPEFADGGAIAFFNVLKGATINIDGTTFYRNIAGDDGGAILIQTNDDVSTGITFINNTFYKNIAQATSNSLYSGGAIQLYANGSRSTSRTSYVNFENNTFAENEVTGNSNAGAIGAYGVGMFSDSNKVGTYFKNNIFVGNKAVNNKYNNIRIRSGFLVDQGGNIGIDNGVATVLTNKDVFGEYDYTIAANGSGITAGASSNVSVIPTLIIRPAGSADNISGPSTRADQRGKLRSAINSDSGAEEIGYVMFDANGGVFNQATPQTSYSGEYYQEKNSDGDIAKVYKVASLGSSVTEPDTVPFLNGKTMKGWSETIDGTILSSGEVNSILSNVDEGKVLYAIYQLEYSVLYDANGGTGTVPVDINNPYNEDGVVTILSDAGLSILGHTFTSWNTQPDGTGTSYLPSTTFVITEDITLYAQWEINKHDLTFNGNSGSPASQTVEVTYDSLLPPLPVAVSKEGHTLEGWYEDIALTIKVDFSSFKMPDNDVVLYAKWDINQYSIKYNKNADDTTIKNIPADEILDFGVLIVEPVPAPERYGYEFLGWYTDKDAISKWNFAIDTVPAADVVLYAKWLKTHFHIIFDINTGMPSTKPEDPFIKAGETADISINQPGSANEPKKAGHVFLGWKTESHDFSQNSFVMPSKDVVLKAEWAEWTSIIKVTSDKNIVVYKDEATMEKIISQINATAKITASNGLVRDKEVMFEWDEVVLKTGGVYTIKPYVLDDLGNKCYANYTIDLYVINRPYISAADQAIFNLGDTPQMDGASWNARLVEEKVDFTTKKIIRLLGRVSQDISSIDNHVAGTYEVKLFATITDHWGNKVDLTKNVLALYFPKTELTADEKLKTDSAYFWTRVSKGLHLSKKNELWYFDKLNYKDDGELRGNIVKGSIYDRKVYVKAEPFFQMSAETLQILKEQTNSQVEVDLGLVKWYFNSTDYKGQLHEPTGFFDLRVKVSQNETVSNLVSGRKNMQLLFSMDKNWQGVHTLEVKLNDSLKNSKNLYMFNFNEDTKELELVGKMNVDNGHASIKMKEIRKQYVILEDIKLGTQSITDSKNTSINSYNSSSKTFSYRVTEKTNFVDEEIKKEIEKSLVGSGKTIDDISLITSTSDANINAKEDSGNNFILQILVLSIALLVLVVFLYIYLKKIYYKKDDIA